MWRARFEVPEFRRCCFCIPLRYGLLVWAYIKLLGAVFFALTLAYQTVISFRTRTAGNYGFNGYMLIAPVAICLAMIADILFTILFIVSGHKKNRDGLIVYYYYSLVMLCIYIVGIVFYWMFLNEYILRPCMAILLQAYILLLIRSEVKKLENSTNVQFVDNEAENMRVDKSDGNTILREETEVTESRTKDIGEYTN